jgi:protein-disulfide isomerase
VAAQQETKPPAAAPAHQAPAHASAVGTHHDPAAAGIERSVEAYLRNLYALGPKFKVTIGAPQPTPVPGLRAVSVEIVTEGQTSGGTVYVSDDGRYLIQGELSDMRADPFAKNLEAMDLSDAAARGPANAKVVVVEYADLQCPSCRQLNEAMKGIVPNYPQVRFVFRDFPLTQIHSWALTAATAGRCIYHKNPAAFWTYSDYMFGHQDLINADNVWQRVLEQGLAAGYDEPGFKACMADPAMKSEIDASTAEGIALKVANTPTLFVNGRRLVGGDREGLLQFIDFELGRQGKPPKP